MKGFYFDLVATPRWLFWLRGGVMLLGLAFALALGAYVQLRLYPQLQQQRGQLQAAQARVDTGQQPVATMSSKDLAQAWQQARDVSMQLTLPWQPLFVQLAEASKGGNVALMSIEPETQKGQVVLVAEARNMDAMLVFLQQLQGSPTFSAVTLQSHAINKAVPEKPVRFRVLASWRSAP